MKNFISRILTIIAILLIIFLFYKISLFAVSVFSPSRSLNTCVINNAKHYFTSSNVDLMINEIERIKKEKRNLRFLNINKLSKTISLLKETFIIDTTLNKKFMFVSDENNFYLGIERNNNFIAHRIDLFYKETFKINRSKFIIGLLKEKGHYIREIQSIKILPRHPRTKILPPPLMLHRIFVYFDHNVAIVTTDKSYLIEVINNIKKNHSERTLSFPINSVKHSEM